MLNHRLAVAVVLALGFSGAAPLAAQRPAPPADLEQLRERAEWGRRMARKGYLSAAQAREFEAQLKAAEAPAPPDKAAPAGPKWEYKVLNRGEIADLGNKDFATGLNKLGDEGWEMVALGPGVRNTQEYYFKRPKARAAGEDPKPGPAKPESKNEDNVNLRLKNIPAVDFANTANNVFGGKAGGGPIIVPEPITNTVLVRGTPRQIEDLRRLIGALDIPEAAPGSADAVTRVELLPLKNAKVADVVKLLQEVYGKDAKTHRLGADERTNTLVVNGQPRLLDEIKALVNKLDVPVPKNP